MKEPPREGTPIERLRQVMAMLRDPSGGCAWDLEQRFDTVAPYTIEEAYEVDDAIRREDLPALCEELGDLLLQVVFHSQMAEEAGVFDFDAVALGIVDKLVRRHPHVFAEEASGHTAEQQTVVWEQLKARERADKAAARGRPAGRFDDVPFSLPALLRAKKLQRRAEANPSWSEARDNLATAVSALSESDEAGRAEAGIGELLFAVVALARAWGVDPETALRERNARFEAEPAKPR